MKLVQDRVLRKVLHQPVIDLAIHHEVVSVRSALVCDVMGLGEIRVVKAAEPQLEPLVPDDERALIAGDDRHVKTYFSKGEIGHFVDNVPMPADAIGPEAGDANAPLATLQRVEYLLEIRELLDERGADHFVRLTGTLGIGAGHLAVSEDQQPRRPVGRKRFIVARQPDTVVQGRYLSLHSIHIDSNRKSLGKVTHIYL
jgi:hypothetical protein